MLVLLLAKPSSAVFKLFSALRREKAEHMENGMVPNHGQGNGLFGKKIEATAKTVQDGIRKIKS